MASRGANSVAWSQDLLIDLMQRRQVVHDPEAAPLRGED